MVILNINRFILTVFGFMQRINRAKAPLLAVEDIPLRLAHKLVVNRAPQALLQNISTSSRSDLF